jgi:hypothetical protein
MGKQTVSEVLYYFHPLSLENNFGGYTNKIVGKN